VRRPGLLLIRISIAANNTQMAAARSGVRRLVAACSASVNRQTGRLAALLHGPRSTIDCSKGVAANPGGKPPACGSIGLHKAATGRRTPERAGPGTALSIRVLLQWGDWSSGTSMVRMVLRSVFGRRQVDNGRRPPVPGSPSAWESGAWAPQCAHRALSRSSWGKNQAALGGTPRSCTSRRKSNFLFVGKQADEGVLVTHAVEHGVDVF